MLYFLSAISTTGALESQLDTERLVVLLRTKIFCSYSKFEVGFEQPIDNAALQCTEDSKETT